MRRRVVYLLIIVLVVLALVFLPRVVSAGGFQRGDTDASGAVEITDPVRVLLYLFAGAPGAVTCQDAADANDSGVLDITDPIYLLEYLFVSGSPPPPPFLACGPDPTADDLGCDGVTSCGSPDELRSSLDRDTDPDVPPEDLAALVSGNTAFAMDLYRAVRGEGENLFFSPLSISQALAMAYAGARGETARQMESALHFTLPQERLHPAFNALDLALASRGHGAAGHAGGGFQLRVVNAAWGQDGYPFQGPYLDVLALDYGTGLRILDFLADPEACRGTINEWVSDQTEQRIQDLLPPGTILPTTRLVLTNAVYFSAAWAQPFPVDATREGDFHRLDGSTARALFMSHRWDFPYAAGDGWRAVELPYDGDELSMVIVVPDEGRFGEIEDGLDGERLDAIIGQLQPGDVQVTMPRFRAETSLALLEKLVALGMVDAAAPGAADFSGIDGTRDLYISAALHKAFVAVDEAGTEAAAATAVVIGVVSVPVDMRVDRPFVLAIRDIATGAILFLGRILTV